MEIFWHHLAATECQFTECLAFSRRLGGAYCTATRTWSWCHVVSIFFCKRIVVWKNIIQFIQFKMWSFKLTHMFSENGFLKVSGRLGFLRSHFLSSQLDHGPEGNLAPHEKIGPLISLWVLQWPWLCQLAAGQDILAGLYPHPFLGGGIHDKYCTSRLHHLQGPLSDVETKHVLLDTSLRRD